MTHTNDNVPEIMHGAQIVQYGAPNDCFKYSEEIPVPQIKSDHEVLVRVKAAGVNPVEAKVAAGNMKLATFIMSLPAIIGADYAGIVVAKGSKVEEFQVGDEVFGTQILPFYVHGSYAQYVTINTKRASIAKKPEHLSFEQAASVGIAALTAYQGIIKNGAVTEANTNERRNILVVGASGGVGSYGVQIAKAINPENHVVGICSEKNIEFVKSLGADRIVNYRDKEEFDAFLEEKVPFDIIFDCVGGEEYYNKLDGLLKKDGVFSTAVGPFEYFGSEHVGVFTLLEMGRKIAYKKLFAPHRYTPIILLPHGDFRTKLAPFFEQGKVRGTVYDKNNIIPLKDIARAHELMHSHRTVGKVVLSID